MPALKTRYSEQPGSAWWRYGTGPTQVITYDWVYRTSFDNLNVSSDLNPGGENPFESEHGSMTGSRGFTHPIPASVGRAFVGTPPSDFLNVGNFGYGTPVSWTSASIWARTNPTRPSIALPVALYELKDIPDMIRQGGRILLALKSGQWRDYIRKEFSTRDLAVANLAIQFGWAPFLSDLIKIAGVQKAFEKRRKAVDRLYSSRGYSQRITLGETQRNETMSRFVNFGTFANYSMVLSMSKSTKTWAVCHWKPQESSAIPPSNAILMAYFLGLHPSQIASNLWEALPWSWLVDYFSNIGDFIQAGNHHLAYPAGGSVMTQYTTVVTHPAGGSPTHGISAGTAKVWKNTRSPLGGSTLEARLPGLGVGQLSVLGSLAVVKARRAIST